MLGLRPSAAPTPQHLPLKQKTCFILSLVKLLVVEGCGLAAHKIQL